MSLTSYLIIQQQGSCPMCDMMMSWGWGGMLLVALFWIVVLAAAVWLIARLVRGRRGRSAPANADDIVRERYARGEIDRETYERMRSELHK